MAGDDYETLNRNRANQQFLFLSKPITDSLAHFEYLNGVSSETKDAFDSFIDELIEQTSASVPLSAQDSTHMSTTSQGREFSFSTDLPSCVVPHSPERPHQENLSTSAPNEETLLTDGMFMDRYVSPLLHPKAPNFAATSCTFSTDFDKQLADSRPYSTDTNPQGLYASRNNQSPFMNPNTVWYSKKSKPSDQCHLCGQDAPISMKGTVVCINNRFGFCRKVVCGSCFSFRRNASYMHDDCPEGWACMHCRNQCPPDAHCYQFERNNQKHRVQVRRSIETSQSLARSLLGGVLKGPNVPNEETEFI